MEDKIDQLVYQAVFGSDSEKQSARLEIWSLSLERGIIPSSINDLYMARGVEKLPHNFTVPAINVRGMAYDLARSAFRVAKRKNVGAIIFELARSEMGYTDQPPSEYASVIRAAALREEWSGPLFTQCDHFQAKAEKPGFPQTGEITAIKKLILEAINAGFYNVDIDMSTLVDLDKKTEAEQQVPNIKHSLELAQFVRSHQPSGITISLGGEIGHIGGVNSNIKDLEAFMSGFTAGLPKNIVGMSKVSVQTGSHHGGVVTADGTLANINVDFSILSDVSKIGRSKYKMGGAVQHGASTLPDEYFGQFAQSEALEVHLATGFQNIQLDHPDFPQDLRKKMYAWLDAEKQDERSGDQTDEQFHYKLRKKAWGQFKQETWDIPEAQKSKISDSLSDRFAFLFKELNVEDTKEMVNKFVKPIKIKKTIDDFTLRKEKPKEVLGLDD